MPVLAYDVLTHGRLGSHHQKACENKSWTHCVKRVFWTYTTLFFIYSLSETQSAQGAALQLCVLLLHERVNKSLLRKRTGPDPGT